MALPLFLAPPPGLGSQLGGRLSRAPVTVRAPDSFLWKAAGPESRLGVRLLDAHSLGVTRSRSLRTELWAQTWEVRNLEQD